MILKIAGTPHNDTLEFFLEQNGTDVELFVRFPDGKKDNFAFLGIEDGKVILAPYSGQEAAFGENAKFFKYTKDGAVSRGK